jgi:HEAT repeat protein
MSTSYTLGRIGLTEAVPSLIDALLIHPIRYYHDFARYRVAAAEALGRIGSDEAVPSLLNVLLNGPYHESWFGLESAAKALVKIGSAEALSALIHAHQNRPEVRRVVEGKLIEIGSTESLSYFIQCRQSDPMIHKWNSSELKRLTEKGLRFKEIHDHQWVVLYTSELEKRFEAEQSW